MFLCRQCSCVENVCAGPGDPAEIRSNAETAKMAEPINLVVTISIAFDVLKYLGPHAVSFSHARLAAKAHPCCREEIARKRQGHRRAA